MATLTVDKPEALRKAAGRVADAGEALVEDARLLTAKAIDLLDEGTRAARKVYTRKLREFDDLKDETALRVRKAPFAAVGITFAVGLLLGVVAGWMAHGSAKE